MPTIIASSKLKFHLYQGKQQSCKICNKKDTTGYICRRLVKWWIIHLLLKIFTRPAPSIFVCDSSCMRVYKSSPDTDFQTDIEVNGSRKKLKPGDCEICGRTIVPGMKCDIPICKNNFSPK